MRRGFDRGTGLTGPPRDHYPLASGAKRTDITFGFNRWAVVHEYEDFHGLLTTFPLRWATATTETAGSPTAAIVADGANGLWKGTLTATAEVQSARLDWGNNRNIPFNKPWTVAFYGQIPVAITTAQRVVIGLAHDHNATFDSNTLNAWFRLEASMALLVEVDDAAVNQDDLATGKTLVAATDYLFTIRYNPLRNSIQFFLDDDMVKEVTGIVLPSTTVQPYVAVQKDSGTGVPSVQIDYADVLWERA